LRPAEKALMHEFLMKNDSLDKGRFEHAVNRMFLDMPDDGRPKHWKEILELLTCANSKAG
jgi:hypothetical protein